MLNKSNPIYQRSAAVVFFKVCTFLAETNADNHFFHIFVLALFAVCFFQTTKASIPAVFSCCPVTLSAVNDMLSLRTNGQRQPDMNN